MICTPRLPTIVDDVEEYDRRLKVPEGDLVLVLVALRDAAGEDEAAAAAKGLPGAIAARLEGGEGDDVRGGSGREERGDARGARGRLDGCEKPWRE